VHAHDFTALGVGSRLSRARRVPLIYDSHELWSERHRTGRPTPLQRRRERVIERRLGRDAHAVVTVGEALAERLRERYGWDHVVVVRNSFPPLAEQPAPAGPTAAVYAGRLAPGRDLETVAAASHHISLPITLIGPADASWAGRFDAGRCTVRPPVEPGDVVGVLRTAGLALVTLADGPENHRLALPNKLFQAVQAGVPVVAADVGELGRTVREHACGVLYRPGDARSLVRAFTEAHARYGELAVAVREAGEALSWAPDRRVLLALYDRLTP
jgi:glycosyltransferase involved in cell wall biosynthesis